MREKFFRWDWQLKSSPEQLWPYFADTNRLNRDTGIFPIEELPGAGLGGGKRRLRFKLPLPVSWEEDPFEWVFPWRYSVLRRYQNAPISSLRILATFDPAADGGTLLSYESWVKPKNWIGSLLIPIIFKWIAPRRFTRAVQNYDTLSMTEKEAVLAQKAVRLARGAQSRLQKMRPQLINAGFQPRLVEKLINLVLLGDELTVARVRPYLCADVWGENRHEVLTLFLTATRIGLLDFQWELLCPMCRGANENVSAHLGEMDSSVHCKSCQIDYQADFEDAVELTFITNPAVRFVERMQFCVAGPEITPHVVVQKLVSPREAYVLEHSLGHGRYRVRAHDSEGSQLVQIRDDAPEHSAVLTFTTAGWPGREIRFTPDQEITLINDTDDERLMILERTAWSDQAATAAEVFNLQAFRDLFSNEALRSGEQISVGSLTILFTDLVDSTRLYREIGDAPAFDLVLDHFSVLQDVVQDEEGVIVKTIGDAVMASFRRPVNALRAIRAAQQRLARFTAGGKHLCLKAGVHQGPSIAVTLNEKLDYFGTTINIAARLEKLSLGDDLIISAAVMADHEVQEYLATEPTLKVTPFTRTLKGFDEKDFQLWRISI